MSSEQKTARQDKENLRRRTSLARDKLIPEAMAKRTLANKKELLKRRYGATLETWSQMLADQGGVCDICKSVPTSKRGFVIDHDHATGKLRGLLCAPCNSALGMLKESPTVAESLIRYVNKHKNQ